MKRFLTFCAIAIVISSVTSCRSPFSYFGKTYPATQNPDLYFRESDITKTYEVMGKLEAEVPAEKRSDKLQRKVMRESANRGADGVIIDNFDLTTGGFSSGTVGGGKRNKKGGSVGVSTSNTQVRKNINVKATLIKYTK